MNDTDRSKLTKALHDALEVLFDDGCQERKAANIAAEKAAEKATAEKLAVLDPAEMTEHPELWEIGDEIEVKDDPPHNHIIQMLWSLRYKGKGIIFAEGGWEPVARARWMARRTLPPRTIVRLSETDTIYFADWAYEDSYLLRSSPNAKIGVVASRSDFRVIALPEKE